MTERDLRWFRFRAAAGGHANDADRLEARIRFESEAELMRILSAFGIAPEPAPPGSSEKRATPVPGDPNVPGGVEMVSMAEDAKIRRTIPGLPRFFQVGWVRIHGIATCVSVDANEGELTLDLVRSYDVTEQEWENAERLEELFASLPFRWIGADN